MVTDIKSRLALAESDLETNKEAAAEAEALLKEEKISAAKVRAIRLRLDAARLALAKVRLEQNTLKYTRTRTLASLRATLVEAKANVHRVQEKTKASETLARKTAANAKAVYNQELERAKDLESEIAKFKIYAPQDGIVVFVVPDRAVWGASGLMPLVAEGEPVHEGQKLMYIPNLGQMQVNIRISEDLIAHVRAGQAAQIQVEAYPDKVLHGRVRAVANVGSRPDFQATDVKVYQTLVAIDKKDTFRGLKPGMSAEVTLSTGEELESVLTVPVRATFGARARGGRRSCLVLTTRGVEEREVFLGLGNGQMAEVKSGLKEGEKVLINPLVVLSMVKDQLRFLKLTGRRRPR
jgi:hypothetical protein